MLHYMHCARNTDIKSWLGFFIRVAVLHAECHVDSSKFRKTFELQS